MSIATQDRDGLIYIILRRHELGIPTTAVESELVKSFFDDHDPQSPTGSDLASVFPREAREWYDTYDTLDSDEMYPSLIDEMMPW